MKKEESFFTYLYFLSTAQNPNTTAPTGNGEGLLVWTELNVGTKRARINSLPANPEDYISSPSIATT